eukprot:c15581_g1_i2.p1 GENE.c15581_g1_i2~~c15581_g1_i2.p1  ORF type:complete len:600 (+),score=153.67 c15581_g1_i2:162-1802(+)
MATLGGAINIPSTGHDIADFLIQCTVSSVLTVALIPILLPNFSRLSWVWVVSTCLFAGFAVVWIHALWDVGDSGISHVFRAVTIVLALVTVLAFFSLFCLPFAPSPKELMLKHLNSRQVLVQPAAEVTADSEIQALELENKNILRKIDSYRQRIIQNKAKIRTLMEKRAQNDAMARMGFMKRMFCKLTGGPKLGAPAKSSVSNIPIDWRISSGLLLGMFCVTTLAFYTGFAATDTQQSLDDIRESLDEMANVFEVLSTRNIRINTTKPIPDFKNATKALRNLEAIFSDAADGFLPAVYTGSILGVFCVIVAAPFTFANYRQIVHELLKGTLGDQEGVKQAYKDIILVVRFVGVQLSSAVTGWLFVLLVVFLTVFLLSLSIFRKFLSNYRSWLVSFIALTVFKMLMEYFASRALVQNGMMRFPRSFFVYDLAMSLVYVLTGVYSALTRFTYALIYVCACLFRLDLCILPPMFRSLDSGYTAFMTIACMQHTHCSPNMLRALEVIKAGGAARAKEERQDGEAASVEQKRRLIRRRWRQAWLKSVHHLV